MNLLGPINNEFLSVTAYDILHSMPIVPKYPIIERKYYGLECNLLKKTSVGYLELTLYLSYLVIGRQTIAICMMRILAGFKQGKNTILHEFFSSSSLRIHKFLKFE